jgi:hypothetical protein
MKVMSDKVPTLIVASLSAIYVIDLLAYRISNRKKQINELSKEIETMKKQIKILQSKK